MILERCIIFWIWENGKWLNNLTPPWIYHNFIYLFYKVIFRMNSFKLLLSKVEDRGHFGPERSTGSRFLTRWALSEAFLWVWTPQFLHYVLVPAKATLLNESLMEPQSETQCEKKSSSSFHCSSASRFRKRLLEKQNKSCCKRWGRTDEWYQGVIRGVRSRIRNWQRRDLSLTHAETVTEHFEMNEPLILFKLNIKVNTNPNKKFWSFHRLV